MYFQLNPIPGSTVSLAVTSTTARVALSATQNVTGLIVTNTGSSLCYFRTGTSTVDATAADIPLAPGQRMVIWKDATATNIAAICDAAASTTLKATLCFGWE